MMMPWSRLTHGVEPKKKISPEENIDTKHKAVHEHPRHPTNRPSQAVSARTRIRMPAYRTVIPDVVVVLLLLLLSSAASRSALRGTRY